MEPKLPKLPKKITPNIQPNNIVRASRGGYGGVKSKGVSRLVRNITGSDNLFTQLRERNPEVSNKRGTRTLFNMLGTFGTERNEKIIRRNLQLLRNTLVETFEIAKLLRMNAAGGSGGSGGGYGGGGTAFLTGIAGAGATAGVLGLGGQISAKIKDLIKGLKGDEGGDTEKGESEEDYESDVSNEEKLVNKELEASTFDEEDTLDSDLEKSSKGLVEFINGGFKGLKEGINKLFKGEGIEEVKEDEGGGDKIEVEEEDTKSESEQVTSLVDGVENSFRDVLKNEVAEGESNNDYGAMYSRDREGFERGNEDITKMTINEVDDLQTDYLNYQTSIGREDDNRSAAMGAYQMLNPKKVAELMGLDPETTIFDEKTQDMMSEYYLKYAGLEDFEAGKISAEEFNNRLAEQFASIETTDGEGVYDDDGMNKAKNNLMDILEPAESKFKGLEDGAFIPGEKKGEVIVIKEGGGVTPVPGSGKKVTMSNGNTGKPKNAGPTLAFPSSNNPDDSNLSTKSILGVIG